MTTYWVDCMGWDGECCGIYIVTKTEDKWGAVCEILSNGPTYTNNQLEYLAVISALEMAQDGDVIYSDSQLVVRQIVGQYGVWDEKLKPLYEQARLLYDSKMVEVKWVPREKNEAGIKVAKDRRKINESRKADSTTGV